MENVFPLAVLVCVNVSGGELEVTVPKTDGDEFRALVVSVVVVDPGLGAVNGDFTVVFNDVVNGGNGEEDGIAGDAVAVDGVESCGIVGGNDIFTCFFLLFGKLELVGQMCKSIGGNGFAKSPNEILGGFAVTVVVVKPEGRLGCAGSSEGVGAAFSGV